MTGVWVGASYVLGRPAPLSEPYPHICGVTVTTRRTRERFRLRRIDCAACYYDARHRRELAGLVLLPPVDLEITTAEARRLGEHD